MFEDQWVRNHNTVPDFIGAVVVVQQCGELEEMSGNAWDHQSLDSWWESWIFKITNVKNQAAEFKWTQVQIILVSMACWFCQNIDMRRDLTQLKSVYFSWLLQTSQDILTHFPVATLFQMSHWQANFASLLFSRALIQHQTDILSHLKAFKTKQGYRAWFHILCC